MTGLYVFGGVIVIGLGALVYYKVKWAKESNVQTRARVAKIEKERVAAEATANHKV